MTPRGEDRPGPRGPGRRYLHRRGQGQRTNCITAGRVGTGRRGVEEDPRMGGLPVGVPSPARDPSRPPGRVLPRYNPPRPPGRGSVWQSTWFGIRGSQVQILPPRRGPSPDGSRPRDCHPRGGHGTGFTGPRIVPPAPLGGGPLSFHCRRKRRNVYIPPRPPRIRGAVNIPFVLDILESVVMELPRMFAQRTPARSTNPVRAKALQTRSLPLDPRVHILAARMAGAGTHLFFLSYRR